MNLLFFIFFIKLTVQLTNKYKMTQYVFNSYLKIFN